LVSVYTTFSYEIKNQPSIHFVIYFLEFCHVQHIDITWVDYHIVVSFHETPGYKFAIDVIERFDDQSLLKRSLLLLEKNKILSYQEELNNIMSSKFIATSSKISS